VRGPARRNTRDPAKRRKTRDTTSFHAGENDEPVHPFSRNARRSLGALRPGEEVSGEDTRLGALAMNLWLPLLTDERSAW
jgi:exodeoxyribonuclease V gamma subunit